MPSNIEIKAVLRDRAFAEEALRRLRAVGPTRLEQMDVFFNCPHGRLKLRHIEGAAAELIYYDRPDQPGPKQSDYVVSRTTEPHTLREALARAYGERGVVAKTRTLYLVGITRVHLDAVRGLGDYLELEVVLDAQTSPEKGQQIADELLQTLGIRPEDLCSTAYLDLITATMR
ncbi:MAG: class IV adenylate cyclase [Tepidisphaeraceae bacterium]